MPDHDLHQQCFFCGNNNPDGLHLHFRTQPDGQVMANFTGKSTLQGYNGILHGGILAGLLDAAMTHCLFAHGIQALTGELKVRYLKTVPMNRTVTVSGRITASTGPLHCLEARIMDGATALATGTGKFMTATRKLNPDMATV